MRNLKIPILLIFMILSLGGITSAQIIDCDAIGESPFDTVRVSSKFVKSGEIAFVPLLFHNETGVATFQLYLEFDSTFMKPLIIGVDSLFDDQGNYLGQTQNVYDYTVTGRLLYTDIKYDDDGFPYLDTTTNVQVVDEIDFPGAGNKQRIKIIGSFEDLFNPEVIITPGNDVVMFVKFAINSNQPQDATSIVNFYDEVIETRSDVFPFDVIRTDCLYSRYGDVTGLTDVRITPISGVMKVDNNSTTQQPPIVNYFTATPSNIQSGQSSTLAWDVTGADEIIINNGVGQFFNNTGTATVYPTTTTSYTLTATNADGDANGFVTVTVGTVIGNKNPVVNSVAGSPFTVNQGESVAFSVTATDEDVGDIITLSAIDLPSGASFNQQVGSGSVTGNFSWTPDISISAGIYVASFKATDDKGGSSNTLTVVINVEEIENDILFSTSQIGQQPVGGLRGKEAVYFPINLVTSQTVYGVQFDFFYDPLYFEVDSFVVTGRTVDYVIYDNIGQTPGEIRVVAFGLNNEPIATVQDTTAILYAVMTIDSNATPDDYPIHFANGWESINPDPNVPSLELVVESAIIQVDNPGDVNLDKQINVADLVNVVASIINNFTLSDRQFDVADVITNEFVDVFDLVGIVNMIFGLPVNSTPSFENETATIALAFNDVQQGDNDVMMVNAGMPVEVAAVELNIDYDPSSVVLGKPSLGSDASSLSLSYNDNNTGRLKIIMNFSNPFNSSQLIPIGDASLLNIPIIAKGEITAGNKDQLKITKALFSTATAKQIDVKGVDSPGEIPDHFELMQNYPNPFNPLTKIDFNLNVSTKVRLDIYNILGQHVTNLVDEYLPAGYHSLEWDATDRNGRPVATGIYLYRIEAEQQTQAKKMLFLK